MDSQTVNDPQANDRETLILKVHWSPPTVVLYELNEEQRELLDEELERLVRKAIEEDEDLRRAQDRRGAVEIERGWIGPTAQAVTTVDIRLSGFSIDFLISISDRVEEYRRRFVAAATSGLLSLLNVSHSVSGIELNPAISFEWEEISPLQPSVNQETRDELIYLTLDVPNAFLEDYTEQVRYAEASRKLGDWFAEGFKESLAEEGVDPSSLQAIVPQRVIQPPLADPLIATFFLPLAGLVAGAIADRVLNKGIDAGDRYVRRKLRERGLTDDVLSLSCSPEELVRRAKAYVRNNGYAHANLEASFVGFNRRSREGFISPIDPDKPMGWDIAIQFYEGEWKFRVLADPRYTELKIFTTAGELINSKSVDLFAV